MDKTGKGFYIPFPNFFGRYAEARVHLRNVKKDLLLALRSIIDAEIKRTEEKATEFKTERAEKVEIA